MKWEYASLICYEGRGSARKDNVYSFVLEKSDGSAQDINTGKAMQILSELGQQHWEAVGVDAVWIGGGTLERTILLKRPA